MNAAVSQLHADLAFAKSQSRPDAEAIVITDQSTVREVLTEIERLKDQIQNPKAYAHRRTEHRQAHTGTGKAHR